MYLEGSKSTDIQIQNGTNRHSVMFTYLGPRGILQNWWVIPTRYRIHRRNTGVHTSRLWIYIICRIINFCRWKRSTDWFVRIWWYCWAVWYRLGTYYLHHHTGVQPAQMGQEHMVCEMWCWPHLWTIHINTAYKYAQSCTCTFHSLLHYTWQNGRQSSKSSQIKLIFITANGY